MKTDARIFWIFLLFLTLPCRGQEYDTLRVATYNLLHYPDDSSLRNPEFKKVLRFMDPDVLIVQEMQSATGVTDFLNNVLNSGQPGTYSAAAFSDGPDTDNAFYYKPSRVSFISQDTLETELRDINGYRVRPVGVAGDSLDLFLYSAHLRASEGMESERLAEADTLRNRLNQLGPAHFIAGGDFNLYTSTEPAFGELTNSQTDNDGRLYDPIATPGIWHDHSEFSALHTQSTRVGNLGDGGAQGGLDDRFDFLLPSYEFQAAPGWWYVSGSYTEFGNDGQHFDQDINAGVNNAVPDSIADALQFSSDHLPVYLDIARQITPTPSVSLVSPNGAEIWYIGNSENITWISEDLPGTVTLEINRAYPGGMWETIVAGTVNDGVHPWNVTAPESEFARIRISVDGQSAINDISDANFFIQSPNINLSDPNGGETWFIGNSGTILWSSQGIVGNVRIELNRNYPIGSWSILFGSAINDGSAAWTISGPVTDNARIRIYSISNPTIGDTSAGNFSIANKFLALDSPNGGEEWIVNSLESIQWTNGGYSGTVTVQLDRQYPSGTWETLFSSLNVGTEFVNWMVTSPLTSQARIRIFLESAPATGDTSNSNFTISLAGSAPQITHDPHGDAAPGAAIFTAKVFDESAGVAAKLFYKESNSFTFDSLAMTATGNPDEFFASPVLSFGFYDYFIRATDNASNTASTDTLRIAVSESCGNELAYDDSTAELFNWAEDTLFAWAVKFTPPDVPFVICEALAAVAVFHPDSAHSPVTVRILDDNGPGGAPGDTLGEFVRGSIGNIIGGFENPGAYWMRFVLQDDAMSPVQVNGDFYIAVQNTSIGFEAFGMDNSIPSGESWLYDSCDELWINETTPHINTRNGNRMIRARGWVNEPSELVIYSSGNDILLSWSSTGAAYYHIYRSSASGGPYLSPIASVSDTIFTDPGISITNERLFYRVVSSTEP